MQSLLTFFLICVSIFWKEIPLSRRIPPKTFRSFSLSANVLFIGIPADRLMHWDPSTAYFFLSAVVNKCIKVNPNTDRKPNNTTSLTLSRWKIFFGWRILSCISFSRKADEQDVCGETETSERKTRCFAMLYNTSGKTSKHPVVFEKAPVLFLKALDLF